ncbi:PQQ-like beta-propeller repeat protein [Actinoplanes sp. TRM 88003]|uniref:PQQ-like beta-propeller repeat protein n=1 Tax=Paractinoplanes aksuensis TaxID=2939490 RepID=A0ABT1DYS5_9ACTN|nr:PQQ-like beta-propeller repeat protein [Actinoplanes aksuensis]MCO8276012.1 PQQ-like beta-propeller repeat protein [Actinoplanes aksuensis]
MTIDLDVAPAAPDRRRAGRTRSGPFVVAALVLALVAASAPPSYAAVLTPVLEGDGREITGSVLTATAIFTQHGGPGDESSDVWARPIDPGGPEWITKVSGPGTGLWLDRSGSVLVSESGDQGEKTFLDARTGHTLWRTGQYSSVRPVGAAVTDWVPPGLLRLRDVTTGRVLWSHPARAFTVDQQQRYVIVFDGRRRPTVLAAADGRVVARSDRLDFEWSADLPSPYVPVRPIGDSLVAVGPTAITAYRLTDLSPRWRTTIARPAVVTGCGGRICAFSDDGLTVLDAVSGAARWAGERWRSLAGDILTDDTGRAARVDLATGRVRAELGRGDVLGDLQLIGAGGERTLVRRLTDGRVLGEATRVAAGACTAAADLLACRTTDARFRVWRVGRA